MFTKEQLINYINEYDVILIGAGAGLSTAAGFEYGGSNFLKHFKYMHDLYGYTDMYSAGFHNFSSPEEKWAFWAKNIYINRYKVGATPLYKRLYEIVKDKNFFVITTNVDHQFQLSGFPKDKLFYTQGDYGLFECRNCRKTFYNYDYVVNMMNDTYNHKISSKLVPKCPICKSNLELNLRCDEFFVEDEGWHEACKRYTKFLEENKNKKILFLELGVGYNTPSIIKYPFMNMTYQNKNSLYLVISKDDNYIPKEIKDRSIIVNDDINKII